MIASINVIDSFFVDPHGVREFALTHDFTQAPEFDGVKYPGFAPVRDTRFTQWLERAMTEAIGADVKINIAAFVAGTEAFETQQWIHSDNACSRFAGVFYLFDNPGFGTAFWNHKETGFGSFSELVKSCPPDEHKDLVDAMQARGRHEDGWIKTDYTESVFNRFIYYPTDRFHSRWPRQAFGVKPINCRLTLAVFFN